LVLLPARVGKKKEGERRLTLDKKEEKRQETSSKILEKLFLSTLQT